MTEQITWVAADGTPWPFDGSQYVTCNLPPAARFAPPVDLATQDVAGEHGTLITACRYLPRTVAVDLAVNGLDGAGQPDAAVTRATIRQLLAALDPTRGDGRLRFATPAGDTRDLVCRCVDGLQGDDSTADPALQEYLLHPRFFAADPFLTDPADSTDHWTIDGAGGKFFPMPPLRIGSSQVFATATITNGGDIETYPVWTITGPGSDLVLVHEATGRRIAWDGTLGDGEQITIDTRSSILAGDTAKSVIRQDGTNLFASLSAWDFWPLAPGSQTVRIELAGATADSAVAVNWRPRYLGV